MLPRSVLAISFLLLTGWAGQQAIEPQEPRDGIVASIITERSFWTADGFEPLAANGKTYLTFATPPKPVAAVLLEIKNNGQPYVEISKVGSVEFPIVLDEFAPGKFVFEHSGSGTYHIRSTDSKGRPAYAKFVIGQTQPPPPVIDPPPVVEPPAGDHAALVAILAKRPSDVTTATALAVGYTKAIAAAQGEAVTLEQARKIVSAARADALRSVPPLGADWNIVLLDAAAYLMKIQTKVEYLAAVKVMAAEFSKTKPAAASQAPAPVMLLNQTCPTCVPMNNNSLLFRRR